MSTLKDYLLSIDEEDDKIVCLLCKGNGDFVDIERKDFLPAVTAENITNCFKPFLDKNDISTNKLSYVILSSSERKNFRSYKSFAKTAGINKFEISSNGFLGMNIFSEMPGICVTNGNHATVSAMDKNGKLYQIGGMDRFYSEVGGAFYIANRVLKIAYDYFFRFGEHSTLTEKIMKLLNINNWDDFLAISEENFENNINEIVSLADEAASKGDEMAIGIFDDMAKNLAKTVLSCLYKFDFNENTAIIKTGRLWQELKYEDFYKAFLSYIRHYGHFTPKVVSLTSPPVVGGIIYAMEKNKCLNLDRDSKLRLSADLCSQINSRTLQKTY